MDLIGLLPSFGNVIWTLVAFVVALSVIVAIHEYGHYIVGRWSGIHADVFSIGMGPVIASRVDRRGTRWQIAVLPIGGYVKFRGDADPASVGREKVDTDDPRSTMAGAPLWARSATVAAGPAFNFVLSILIFTLVVLWRGIAADPLTVDSVRELPQQNAAALMPGDEILAIAGEATPQLAEFSGFVDRLPVDETLPYRVRRGDEELTFDAPYPAPPLVASVTPQSAAMAAGLSEGDVITRMDGRPIASFEELRDAVEASGGDPIDLTLWRSGGEQRQVTLTPRSMDLPLPDGGFETRWLIGVTGGLYFSARTETPGVIDALTYGVDQTAFIVRSSLSGLYHMAVGAISSCNLSGPIGIAQTSGAAASQGWVSFVWFIAVLSTAVGLLNLFPIPVLDGGHLVFHVYEAVVGRPPSERALNVLMAAGLTLLISLMLFAVTNDIFCP